MTTLLIYDRDAHSTSILSRLVAQNMPTDVSFTIHEASKPETLVDILAAGAKPDILLIATNMPKGQPSGIEIVRRFFPPDSGTQVIYVSDSLEQAPEVYSTPHLYFLLKPIDQTKLSEALERACATFDNRKPAMLRIKSGYKERLIDVSTITYLESSVHKVTIHCDDASYKTYAKLDDVLALLPSSFCRCHRSFAVNLPFVSSLDEDEIILYDGTHVPVSRRRARQTQKELLEFLNVQEG